MCHFIWRSINSLFCVFQFVSMGHCSTHRSLMVVGGKSVLCSLGVITKHPFYWFFWIISWLIIDKEKGIELGIRASPESEGEVRGTFLGVSALVSLGCFIESSVPQKSPGAWRRLVLIKHLSDLMDHIQLVFMSASILWYQCGYYPPRAETTDA